MDAHFLHQPRLQRRIMIGLALALLLACSLAFTLQKKKVIWRGGCCTFTLNATPVPSCYWDNLRNYNYPLPALIALAPA